MDVRSVARPACSWRRLLSVDSLFISGHEHLGHSAVASQHRLSVAAIDYLDTRPDVTAGIGIVGLSMGGEEAINAAASDPRIAAVVADGAGVGSYDDSVASGAHAMARLINWTQYRLIEVLSDAPQPAGIVASLPEISPRPVLIISGEEAVEKEMGPIYAEAGGATTELWELRDTPHTKGLSFHRSDYTRRVLHLFKDALLGTDATDTKEDAH